MLPARYLFVAATLLSIPLSGATAATPAAAPQTQPPMNVEASQPSINTPTTTQNPPATLPLTSGATPQEPSERTPAPIVGPSTSASSTSLHTIKPCALHYGQTNGKRVRMRVAAQLDAPIISELDKDTPVEICGETEEFYAVRPPKSLKAYVFRTYVLDGKIEGERVNVRLEPSAGATIVTQLSSGTPIQGQISAENAKWLEIDLPASVRFFISKDYVQPIDKSQYEQLAAEWTQKTNSISPVTKPSTKPSTPTPTAPPEKIVTLSKWQQQELAIETQWLKERSNLSRDDYLMWQKSAAQTLEGELERYDAASFAPGDFTLRGKDGRILGIVYSANVDLLTYNASHVRVQVLSRENHHFAYPAFCVISLERISQ